MRKFTRLRGLVEAMPEGDQDREELLELLSLFDRQGKRLEKLKTVRRDLTRIRTRLRQTEGALGLVKWLCQEASQKLEDNRLTIDWLSRRLRQASKLTDHEKTEIQKIRNNIRQG